ncbi:ABC transporter permease [Micromonospora sp. CPCC 205539]|uniref:ABC transporter permease n=1 Tax=Micromonospora sp. CPCC 205539 TaxID=3122408 RepID=UPI002FF0D19E
MVTMAIAHRLSARRAAAVLERNGKATRVGPSYWLLLVSGILEPLLYLLSIGVGVGQLIGGAVQYGDLAISYQSFVAPAMLAFCAFSGAFGESIFGFFSKLKFAGVVENQFAAGVRATEIVAGELVAATLRGAVYSLLFLGVTVAFGLVTLGAAVPTLAATVLIGAAFSALGLAISATLRGWQDFELVTTGQLALFLFSGTFAPIATYPPALQVIIEATPLYHAVELVRALSLGAAGQGTLVHAAYLAVMIPVCGYLAVRQVDRALRR